MNRHTDIKIDRHTEWQTDRLLDKQPNILSLSVRNEYGMKYSKDTVSFQYVVNYLKQGKQIIKHINIFKGIHMCLLVAQLLYNLNISVRTFVCKRKLNTFNCNLKKVSNFEGVYSHTHKYLLVNCIFFHELLRDIIVLVIT